MKNHYCQKCGVVPISEPEYCCGGSVAAVDHFCGCMGLPIDPPYCYDCLEELRGDVNEQ